MVIIQKRTGRFANRLLLFSKFIANSIEHNYELINPCFYEYRKYFKSTRENDFGDFSISVELPYSIPFHLFSMSTTPLSWILPKTAIYEFVVANHQNPVDMTESAFYERAVAKTVFARGWNFMERENIVKHSHIIRKFFTPDNKVLSVANENIKNLKNQCDTVVGVHIRRGDYRKWQNGKFFYTDEVYLDKMMQLKKILNKKGKTPGFLISSNENIEPNHFDSVPVRMAAGSELQDLYSLSMCDFILGPPSTYSMWASFYGQTQVHFIRSEKEKIKLESCSRIMH